VSDADVIVAGGGITGLAAAHSLASAGVSVTLLESSDRFGGSVQTIDFAGRALDVGAEMLLTRQPAAVELCHELGLGDELVAPVAAPAHVLVGRRLRPLPAGITAGLLRSRILSPGGALRAARDLVTPSRAPAGDVAIGAIVRDRLGVQVLDRIVDPVLGGIHAGRCDDLSAEALAPRLLEALGRGRGLLRGLRGQAAAFVTLRGGLETLADALVRALGDARLGTTVRSAIPDAPGHVRVELEGGEELHARALVLATPADAAARILAIAAPDAAAELSRIEHASVATVALAYPAEALEPLPHGTGFLAAPSERCLVTACTWSSRKWSHLAGEPAIVKAFVGRAGEPPPAAALVDLVHGELGLRPGPLEAHVQRFEAAMPQYAVGHLARVARIEQALPAGVGLAGMSYRGAGVPACVRSGRRAAERVLGALAVPISRSHT
jgi:oxygen-dependent protoporphyrinogen oxidase